MSAHCPLPEPLGRATLVDYWSSDLPAGETDRVEQHLLECDACGAALRELVAIGDGVRRLSHAGAFHVVISPSFLEAAARRGLRVREYRVPPGGRVACTVTAEDDLLVGRLQGDFREVTRLDLVVQVDGGPEHRAVDVPVSPAAPELIVAQAMPALRAMKTSVIRMRLIAREGDGEPAGRVAGALGDRERVVGEYTFAHTAAS